MELWNQILDFIKIDWMINWVIPVVVALVIILLSRPLLKAVFGLLRKILGKKRQNWAAEAVKVLSGPLRFLLMAAALLIGMRISPAVYGNLSLWATAVKCFRSVIIIVIAWALYNLEDSSELLMTPLTRKLDLKINDVLLPFVSKGLRFITIAIALLIVAQEWDYSISGMLAGLGLGGLAFALAAQDMLSNLFGGAVILLDKPFAIGDWIKSDATEGVVEDITFRSVRIRTFTQALVTIPNSNLVSNPVTNFSRMGKRRINFNLGLEYGTPAQKLRACSERIKAMLAADENLDPETQVVVLDSFGDSSINLMLLFFTKATDWLSYIHAKEKVYYAIMDILEQEQVVIAFPTQTLHVFRETLEKEKQEGAPQ